MYAFEIQAHGQGWVTRCICYNCGRVTDLTTCPKCDGLCTTTYTPGRGGCDACRGEGVKVEER